MTVLRDIAPFVALAALAAAAAALVALVLLQRDLRRLRRGQAVVLGHRGERDIVQHAEDLDEQVRNLRDAVADLTRTLERHGERLGTALLHTAVVRYDAFRDTGGEQSASIALLDDHRSGVVISTIAARDFSRLYVKHLRDGVPDRELSPEEEEAVAAAVPSPRPAGGGRDAD